MTCEPQEFFRQTGWPVRAGAQSRIPYDSIFPRYFEAVIAAAGAVVRSTRGAGGQARLALTEPVVVARPACSLKAAPLGGRRSTIEATPASTADRAGPINSAPPSTVKSMQAASSRQSAPCASSSRAWAMAENNLANVG